jgi:hypothetical protein
LVQRLSDSGLVSPKELRGCSLGEIHKVESAFGIRLPAVYIMFLKTMGKSAGRFLKGSSAFYPELLKLRGYAEELLREDSVEDQLTKRDFVFFVHQGYQFAYFQLDEGDDPPVWCFAEGWEAPVRKFDSLSEFMMRMATDHGPNTQGNQSGCEGSQPF